MVGLRRQHKLSAPGSIGGRKCQHHPQCAIVIDCVPALGPGGKCVQCAGKGRIQRRRLGGLQLPHIADQHGCGCHHETGSQGNWVTDTAQAGRFGLVICYRLDCCGWNSVFPIADSQSDQMIITAKLLQPCSQGLVICQTLFNIRAFLGRAFTVDQTAEQLVVVSTRYVQIVDFGHGPLLSIPLNTGLSRPLLAPVTRPIYPPGFDAPWRPDS